MVSLLSAIVVLYIIDNYTHFNSNTYLNCTTLKLRYHKLRGIVDILLTEKEGKPLIPFILSDTPDCNQYASCVGAVDTARSFFDPDVDVHIQDFDMVFHRELRDEFCLKWHLLKIPVPDDPCVARGPTATSYYSFLKGTKRVQLSNYFFVLFF